MKTIAAPPHLSLKVLNSWTVELLQTAAHHTWYRNQAKLFNLQTKEDKRDEVYEMITAALCTKIVLHVDW